MGLLEISHRFIITPVCDLFALPPSSSRNRQKIDLCRFDSVLRYLDAPDPTGERFGIKADGRWTDTVDKEMEKARDRDMDRDKQGQRHTGRQAHRQPTSQSDRQAIGQTHRQT